MKRSSRATAELSDSTHHQLNMYALAASTAGVGVLALSAPAEAKVVYTPAHVVIKKDSNIVRYLDLNHDGIKDFDLSHVHNASSRFAFSGLFIGGQNASNRVMGVNHGGGGYYASALVAGAKIGPTSRSSKSHPLMASATSPASRLAGYWANDGKGVKNRYLGLRFLINGKVHYGWARLNITVQQQGQGHSIAALLTGYAYETVANKPIIAGKTKGTDAITLEPGSLGRLAQGSAGRSGK